MPFTLPRLASTAAFVALLAPLGGCVAMPRYNEAVADAERARVAQLDTESRAQNLRAEVEKLSAEVKAREAKLSDTAVDLSNVHKQSDDLVLMNAELTRRLEKAGQSVQQLASERGNLSVALAETKKKLDELGRMEAQAEARANETKALMKTFQSMVDAGQLKVLMRGGRVVLELPNDALFDPAKVTLKEQGRGAVAGIAKVLRAMKGRHFEVAGHTDDAAIKSPHYASNWELSTARAVVVTKLLVDKGVEPKTLSAAGYGEWAPLADNGGPDGRAKNRRIEITLLPVVDDKTLER